MNAYVLKEGWLIKRGRLVKNWKKRYFVLCGNRLGYFTDPSLKKVKGALQLSAGDSVTESVFNGRKFVFSVETQGRVLQLQGQSDHDVQEWLRALRMVIKKNPNSGKDVHVNSDLYIDDDDSDEEGRNSEVGMMPDSAHLHNEPSTIALVVTPRNKDSDDEYSDSSDDEVPNMSNEANALSGNDCQSKGSANNQLTSTNRIQTELCKPNDVEQLSSVSTTVKNSSTTSSFSDSDAAQHGLDSHFAAVSLQVEAESTLNYSGGGRRDCKNKHSEDVNQQAKSSCKPSISNTYKSDSQNSSSLKYYQGSLVEQQEEQKARLLSLKSSTMKEFGIDGDDQEKTPTKKFVFDNAVQSQQERDTERMKQLREAYMRDFGITEEEAERRTRALEFEKSLAEQMKRESSRVGALREDTLKDFGIDSSGQGCDRSTALTFETAMQEQKERDRLRREQIRNDTLQDFGIGGEKIAHKRSSVADVAKQFGGSKVKKQSDNPPPPP